MSARSGEAPFIVEWWDEERKKWHVASYELSERMARRATRNGGVRRYRPNPHQSEKSRARMARPLDGGGNVE